VQVVGGLLATAVFVLMEIHAVKLAIDGAWGDAFVAGLLLAELFAGIVFAVTVGIGALIAAAGGPASPDSRVERLRLRLRDAVIQPRDDRFS
jgi:hypothetical protein